MVPDAPKVLLFQTGNQDTLLTSFLRQRRCTCLYAASGEEAERLLRKENPDLLLVESRACDIALRKLVQFLLVAGTSDAYYAHSVETGSWWLPILVKGRPCLGAPALRPWQFAGVLDELIRSCRGKGAMVSDGQPR